MILLDEAHTYGVTLTKPDGTVEVHVAEYNRPGGVAFTIAHELTHLALDINWQISHVNSHQDNIILENAIDSLAGEFLLPLSMETTNSSGSGTWPPPWNMIKKNREWWSPYSASLEALTRTWLFRSALALAMAKCHRTPSGYLMLEYVVGNEEWPYEIPIITKRNRFQLTPFADIETMDEGYMRGINPWTFKLHVDSIIDIYWCRIDNIICIVIKEGG